MKSMNARAILMALVGAAGALNVSQTLGRRTRRVPSFDHLGSPEEQKRRIHAAKERRERRSAKRQRDYDRCITNNPLFSGPLTFVLVEARANEAAKLPMVEMRYCGEKKKLQGKKALVRQTGTSGQVVAQFNDLELRWRNVNLAHGWHEFRREEFEAI